MKSELETHKLTDDEEELKKLLVPDVATLPLNPPSAVQSNFVTYFAPGNSLHLFFFLYLNSVTRNTKIYDTDIDYQVYYY